MIPILSEDDTGGSISIVRLTVRNVRDQLIVVNNCLDCDTELPDYRDVYYVADLTELASPTYAISIARQPEEEPLENYILYAGFNSTSDMFVATGSFFLPNIYYGDQNVVVSTRPWVTKLQEFEYGTETDGLLCYTTCHNGGVILWDPAGGESPDIYWVSVSQYGAHGCTTMRQFRRSWVSWETCTVRSSWRVPRTSTSRSWATLLSITVSCSSPTSRWDSWSPTFSRPTRPQHIWQWDCDLRPHEYDPADWDWHGAGHMTFDTMDQADTGTFRPRHSASA